MSCMALDFAVEDGVATVQTALLQGGRVDVTGEGEVDIGRGVFDLTLTPHVSDPGLLSIAATVRVSGPLEAPVFSPVKRSIATSAMRALASNVLRPATSLFRSSRDEASVDEQACRIAPAGPSEAR